MTEMMLRFAKLAKLHDWPCDGKELLEGLDAHTAHAPGATQGSAKRYELPTEPIWDEIFESDESAKGNVAFKGILGICLERDCTQDEMMMPPCSSRRRLSMWQRPARSAEISAT